MAKDPAETTVPTGALKAMGWFFENSLDTFVTTRATMSTAPTPPGDD